MFTIICSIKMRRSAASLLKSKRLASPNASPFSTKRRLIVSTNATRVCERRHRSPDDRAPKRSWQARKFSAPKTSRITPSISRLTASGSKSEKGRKKNPMPNRPKTKSRLTKRPKTKSHLIKRLKPKSRLTKPPKTKSHLTNQRPKIKS